MGNWFFRSNLSLDCRLKARRDVNRQLGTSLGSLGGLLGCLGASWAPLGPSWAPLGVVLGPLGWVLGPLGHLLGRSWGLLGGSWGLLGRSKMGPKIDPKIDPKSSRIRDGPFFTGSTKIRVSEGSEGRRNPDHGRPQNYQSP